ncbi:brain-specific angiogenesis inhibitor 1-associated protein 2-like protein 2 [Sorex fumeus]|uniref:brain-specific angiogenesis inhibitor 1-associated protein 2-like protein 2 n=1 Tax=Sorex fumeus TaxID=62283 RepID=UPI0024AD0EC8|nr:brain-specific angiogenesis inhibitor 1-associated protein 2-like protein 2 [Sorex fumeus]
MPTGAVQRTQAPTAAPHSAPQPPASTVRPPRTPEMNPFYRSTMTIYQSIMEQFNPALENLVYLGNNYLRAFHALSQAAEVYFSAIQKIGEQALQSTSSQILGEILVQMSDTQRHLNSDLEEVVQKFHSDLLQHMEKNSKLDMQYIKDSRQHYELEYRHRVASLEKCKSDLWRLERKRDKNVREMKENVNRLNAQMQDFMSSSQRAAELEEKRRYRFLAEKHLVLANSYLQYFGRAQGLLQSRVVLWKEQTESSRAPSRAHSPGLLGPPYPSGRLTPTRPDMPPQRSLGEFGSPGSRLGSGSYGPEALDARSASQLEPDRRSLPRTSSASSLYGAFAERAGGGGARRVRALVSHSQGANHTLLCFSAGDVVEVLVPEARNGWLYGRLEGSAAAGWFPEAYVKPLEMPMDPLSAFRPVSPLSPLSPLSPMNELPSRSYPLRGSHSLDDLLDRPGYPLAASPSRPPSRAPSPAPPPPPLPTPRRDSVSSTTTSDSKKLASWEQQPPELFPRGTNPFATVKLRPTTTNDRSAPLIR